MAEKFRSPLASATRCVVFLFFNLALMSNTTFSVEMFYILPSNVVAVSHMWLVSP